MKNFMISCAVCFILFMLIALIFSCPFERAISNCWLPAILFGGYCTYIMNEEERKRQERLEELE